MAPARGGLWSLSPTLPQHQGCAQSSIFPHTSPIGPALACQIGLNGLSLESSAIWRLISVVSYFGSYQDY